MSPTWPLLFFFFLCLLTKEKMAHAEQVESEKNEGSKSWLIKTTNNEEVVEHDADYQDDNDDDDIEPVCSSDRHGSVGLAIDTTAWVFSI